MNHQANTLVEEIKILQAKRKIFGVMMLLLAVSLTILVIFVLKFNNLTTFDKVLNMSLLLLSFSLVLILSSGYKGNNGKSEEHVN
ncbi:hypothetical protein U8V72_21170 [Priestia filamentosa]|uniref:hypothetical protein n=1 Tax=Priestia filamentosa TaxID=1402861 RepID=UPI00397B40E7